MKDHGPCVTHSGVQISLSLGDPLQGSDRTEDLQLWVCVLEQRRRRRQEQRGTDPNFLCHPSPPQRNCVGLS